MPSLRTNVVASVLFTFFGGPAIILVLVPYFITHFRIPADEPRTQIAVTILLILIGLIPLFESIIRFVVVGRGSLVPIAPPEHLVVSGLYRFVRNPMYVGVLTVIAGQALLLMNRGMFIHLGLVWLLMQLFVVFYEEPKLTRTFPREYLRYKRHVGRWIPRFTPWSDSPQHGSPKPN
jgi:protein-S-isoprenylcysteine O-methyltransferase Ste14